MAGQVLWWEGKSIGKPSENSLAADNDKLRLARDAFRRPQDVLEVGAFHIGAESACARPAA
jgi:hypothetical protein